MSDKQATVCLTVSFFHGESLPSGLADPDFRLGVTINQRTAAEQPIDVVHWSPEPNVKPQTPMSTFVSGRAGWSLLLPGAIEHGEAFARESLGTWVKSQPFFEKLSVLNNSKKSVFLHMLLPKDHVCTSAFVYRVGAYFI